jgi:hypothetical protein
MIREIAKHGLDKQGPSFWDTGSPILGRSSSPLPTNTPFPFRDVAWVQTRPESNRESRPPHRHLAAGTNYSPCKEYCQ